MNEHRTNEFVVEHYNNNKKILEYANEIVNRIMHIGQILFTLSTINVVRHLQIWIFDQLVGKFSL